MISKSNVLEFKEQLNRNTKHGNPKIKGTPFIVFSVFGESHKIFFGKFDNAKFELTINSIIFPTPYIISGKYSSKSNSQTEVVYEIKPIGFGYYWLKYLPLITFVIFNFVLYRESETLEVFIIINIALIVFAICSYIYLWNKKRKLKEKFHRVFEVGI